MIIVLLLAVFAGFLLRVAFVGDPFDEREEEENLGLMQNGLHVIATWGDMGSEEYEVRYYIDGHLTIIPSVEGNTYTVRGVYPGQRCKVTVRALNDKFISTADASAELTAEKIKQVIQVDSTVFYGFEGTDLNLKAQANGDLHYRSTDKSIVKVDGKGHVDFEKKGDAEIIITADGNGLFADTDRTLQVYVYPHTLDKITNITVENISPSRAVIRWEPDEYAASYKVLRLNQATQEYEEVAEKTDENAYLEVTRDDYDYGIKGSAEVNGEKVDGKISDPVKVRGTAEEAPSYTSYKNIKSIHKEQLERVATISGTEKSRVPQSLSIIGDDYVVAYVNMKSTVGNLISYSRKDGSQKKISSANGIRHGNGCTYNPNTNRLYVLSTMNGEKSKKCYVFDAKSKKLISKINMPVAASAIAYDKSTDKFYLGRDRTLYVCDSGFNLEKTIDKGVRHFNQDMEAYNGVMLVCNWHSPNKTKSDIDMYRVSDGAYIGSYDVSIGEVESCAMDDGYLVILMNTIGSGDDYIYKTKERIAIP